MPEAELDECRSYLPVVDRSARQHEISRLAASEIGLPVHPWKRKLHAGRAMSVSGQYRKWIGLFNHLISAGNGGRRHHEAERFRSFEIDGESVPVRLINRNFARLFPSQNLVDT